MTRDEKIAAAKEEWRPIPGWPHAVSNRGRVKRTAAPYGRTRVGKILKAQLRFEGAWRYRITLWNGARRKDTFVHQLVCAAFHGPRPSRRHEAAHWDGDGTNNDPSNLRWATRKENAADCVRHGTDPVGERNPAAKLRERDVLCVRRAALKGRTSTRALADRFGITREAINAIIRGATWRHLPMEGR